MACKNPGNFPCKRRVFLLLALLCLPVPGYAQTQVDDGIVIADFEDLAAIRADASKYDLTGIFANAGLSSWSVFDHDQTGDRVGSRSVSTWRIDSTTGAGARGSIRINGVQLSSRYINFLMTGGGSGADVGIAVMFADSNLVLAAWTPTECDPKHLVGNSHWAYFDMGHYKGSTVDIVIYDNDSDNECGFLTLDHLYQADSHRGDLRSRINPGRKLTPGSRVTLPDLKIFCPCSAESLGPTGVRFKAGVRNIGAGASENAEIQIHAAAEGLISRVDSGSARIGRLPPGGETSLDSVYTVGWEYPLPENLGPGGSAYLALSLAEYFPGPPADPGSGFWLHEVYTDRVLLEEAVTMPEVRSVGGTSRDVIIDGKPTLVETSNHQATLTIPRVINASSQHVTITRLHIEHGIQPFFGQGGWRQAWESARLSLEIPPGGSIENIQVTADYSEPQANAPAGSEDYTHLILFGNQGSDHSHLAWQTIGTREGVLQGDFSFSVTSDRFTDDDGDGVSNYNERLAQTDPSDPASKPGTVTLDVMALYTPETSTSLNDAPVEQIIQWLEWGSTALRDSQVDARFRLVAAREVRFQGTSPLRGNALEMLDGMRGQTGVFAGIDAERQAAGADLLVAIVHEGFDSSVCGVAYPPASHGDYITPGRHQLLAVSAAHCASRTLTHELGHNLGLAHSALQFDGGTWPWARGHGVEGKFATIMSYTSRYNLQFASIEDSRKLEKPMFSNPRISCGTNLTCGVSRDNHYLGADAAGAISATMFTVARLSPSPPDTDGDGMVNGLDLDDDNDGLSDQDETSTHGTDPLKADSDDDGLADNIEVAGPTNPLLADTDGDNVNDGQDDFPLDPGEWTDADGDGLGANTDADDNDPGITLIRKRVNLTAEAIDAANLIAGFEEGPAAIRADATKYSLTGVFADASLTQWNDFDDAADVARVGERSVSTWQIGSATGAESMGSIRIKNVTLASDYINFLMAGGDGSINQGVAIYLPGTFTALADWQPNDCADKYLKGDRHWRHFDVSQLLGETVDIEIYDRAGTGSCGFITFDHFHHGAAGQGTLVGAASMPSLPPTGVSIDRRNYINGLVLGLDAGASFENPPAMIAAGWEGLGYFENPQGLNAWVGRSSDPAAARVGERAISTCLASGTCTAALGTLQSPAFRVTGNYLRFLAAGGNGDDNVGVRLEDTFGNELRYYQPSTCNPQDLKGYIEGDDDWAWFDLSAIKNAFVRLSIIDLSASACGFVSVDHAYQADTLHQPGTGTDAGRVVASQNLGYGILLTDPNLVVDQRILSRFDNPQTVLGADGWQATGDFALPSGSSQSLAEPAYSSPASATPALNSFTGANAWQANGGFALSSGSSQSLVGFDRSSPASAAPALSSFTGANAWQGASGAGRVGDRAVSTCNMQGPGQCVDALGTLTSPLTMVDASYPYLALYMAGGNGAAAVGARILDATGQPIPGLEHKPVSCGTRGNLEDSAGMAGTNSHLVAFDLRTQAGNMVQLQIFDDSQGDCGYVSFDHAYMTGQEIPGARAPLAAGQPDADGDGYPDGQDACPNDIAPRFGWADADRDGTCDKQDAFPNNPSETRDADGDGLGDNRDTDDTNPAIAYETMAERRARQGIRQYLPSGVMQLPADARNPAKVIADMDDPAAMQRNLARYSLTGIFARMLAEGQGWNNFEIQDAEEIARQQQAASKDK